MHNSFVYNLRLLFSKDTIGPIPPAVLLLSDGGHYQNLALLPLLQRKVKRIVVVDGGHKDKEDKYGDSILDALKIARTQLNCSFYNEDGKDVITDLMPYVRVSYILGDWPLTVNKFFGGCECSSCLYLPFFVSLD